MSVLEKADCILLDDDILIHLTWKMAAKTKSKTLIAFEDSKSFLESIEKFELHTPIYIDSNLREKLSGEEIARQILAKGFTQVYIATGYSTDQIEPVKGLSGVVGKNPPF